MKRWWPLTSKSEFKIRHLQGHRRPDRMNLCVLKWFLPSQFASFGRRSELLGWVAN